MVHISQTEFQFLILLVLLLQNIVSADNVGIKVSALAPS